MAIRLTTYEHAKDIPELPGTNVFHSTDLFRILEQTPGYRPVLLVAFEGDKPIGKLLCITRRNFRLLGFTEKTYVYGVGEYFNTERKREEIFNELLTYFTTLYKEGSFLLEFRNLEEPLFGYRYFRQNGYFPVRWLSASRKRQIARGLKNGASIEIASSLEDIRAFFMMLKKYYSPKVHRYLPDFHLFAFFSEESFPAGMGKIFIVRYKEKIIGGSVCLFSDDTAYLMFSAGMRKSYPLLYPGVLAVWEAMTYAREHGYSHFEFIEAGLPFKKFSYRDFILRFGGKQLSTRRWFKVRWNWLNRLLIRIYV